MSFQFCDMERYLIGTVVLLHQFDDNANHVLIANGVKSDPMSYHGIAVVDIPEGKFAATTEYYGDSLPRVFMITAGMHV